MMDYIAIKTAVDSERRINAVSSSLLILSLWAIFFSVVQYCDSNPVEAYDKTSLSLVQCLIAECDRCNRDEREIAGMAWVIEKLRLAYNRNPRNKTKRSYRQQVEAYCAIFDKRFYGYTKPRSVDIRTGTFESPTHIGAKHWDRLRKFSQRFLSGKVIDPHPEADLFGGGCDLDRAIRNHWTEEAKYCDKNGKWCNYFWNTKQRRGEK